MKGWGLTPEGLGCELQTTQVTGIQGRETSGWQAPGGLDPWHSEAVRPWVSPSTFLSLRESRGPLWSPVLMPAGHGLKIYVECQVLCLANGNCSGIPLAKRITVKMWVNLLPVSFLILILQSWDQTSQVICQCDYLFDV